MSDRFDPFLGELAFEVRYNYGYSYLDHCGQTLIDIERAKPDWVAGEIVPQSGNLQNPKMNYSIAFDVKRFVISAFRPNDTKAFAQEAHSIWGTIRDNLGLLDFIRTGCRFNYYLPTRSLEEAESKLTKARLNLILPEDFDEKRYKPKFREMSVTLERDGFEYRVALRGVTRNEMVIPASSLVSTNPRLLSSHQREARNEAFKARAAYKRNPEYAIHLDIDCTQYEPQNVKPSSYISECDSVVQNDFYRLLTYLR